MLVGGAAMLLASPSAEAHALLVSADPGDGVGLRTPPRAVTLAFTEEPDVKLSSVRVLDASGGSHEQGSPQAVAGRPRSLRIGVTGLDEGVYTVSWRVVSRVDGHYTSGAYAFGVRVDPSEIEAAEIDVPRAPPISPFEVAGRLMLYLGLAGMVGAAWVGVFLVPRGPSDTRRVLVGAWALGVVGVVLLSVAQKSAAGAPWGAFFDSPIGRALTLRAVLLLVAGAGIAFSGVGARVAVLGAGVAAIGVHVSSGHAATGSFALVKVATQLVHFSAVAVWIGGLAALLFAVRGAPSEDKARAVRRFSVVAGVTLAAVVGTGTARAVAEVGSWDGLFGRGYGRLVIVKVALVAIIAALAARNRWWNVPRGVEGLGGLRRVSRFEIGAAGVVLVATALLASLVPARSASLAEPASVALEGSDFARTVRVQLTVTPGFPGGNEFIADVETLRGDEPVEGVTLRLSSEDAGIRDARVPLRRSRDLWRVRAAVMAVQGVWRVAVVVHRGAATAEIPLTFHTRCRADAPTTDGSPRIYDIDLAGGDTVQAYVDPAEPGRNEVHFTFFDEQGMELPMADDPNIDAFLERSEDLDVRHFSAGHFIAGASLAEGRWIFSFDGSTTDGDAVTVCFSDEI